MKIDILAAPAISQVSKVQLRGNNYDKAEVFESPFLSVYLRSKYELEQFLCPSRRDSRISRGDSTKILG
jgi:hypothetical protein